MKREFLVSTAIVLCLAAAACSKTKTPTAANNGTTTTTTSTTTTPAPGSDQSATTSTAPPSDQTAAATPPATNDSATGSYNGTPSASTDTSTSSSTASTTPGTDEAALPPSTSAQGFVQRAATSDMYEIAASKALLAKSGVAKNVRDFAQMMITAHTDSTNQLKTIAASEKLSLPSGVDATHQAEIDQINAADAAQASTLYLQQQTDAHQQALQLLQNYSSSGDDAALKQFAQNIQPTVQSHLDSAKALQSGSTPPTNM